VGRPRHIEGLRQLVRTLPRGERALVGVAAFVDFVSRAALVGVAGAAVEGSRVLAAAVAAALVALTVLRRVLGQALVRRCRSALYDESVCALLAGPLLSTDDESPQQSLIALAQGLFVGETFLSTTLPGVLGDALAAVLLGGFLATRTPPDVLAVTAIAVAILAATLVAVRGVMTRSAAASERAFKPVFDGLMAAQQGRLEIVASGRDEAFATAMRDRLRAWRKVAVRSDLFASIAGRVPVVAATAVVGIAVVVDQGLRGVLHAVALREAVLVASVVPAVVGLARHAGEAVRASSRVRPLLDVLSAAAPKPAGKGTALPELPAAIEWREVTFAYEAPARAAAPVLRDVSLVWEPGEVLLLRGANGSGKSTMFRLLLALARPQKGTIRVGPVELDALDASSWRRSVAYLPQRPYLRDDDTVRDAIRFLVPDASDEAMLAALDRVALLEPLRRRHAADPLSARVGALSAGQRQRLALARVLCREAPIVLLDEPDANLDAEGIALVVRLLRELARDRMVAVAAHGEGFAAVADVVASIAPDGPARVLRRSDRRAAEG